MLVLMDASAPLTISAFVSMGFYFDFDAQNTPDGGEQRIGVTGFTITDEAGDLITGATYRTESGSQYNFANAAYAAVPEPATLSLAAFAIGGLAALEGPSLQTALGPFIILSAPLGKVWESPIPALMPIIKALHL